MELSAPLAQVCPQDRATAHLMGNDKAASGNVPDHCWCYGLDWFARRDRAL